MNAPARKNVTYWSSFSPRWGATTTTTIIGNPVADLTTVLFDPTDRGRRRHHLCYVTSTGGHVVDQTDTGCIDIVRDTGGGQSFS